jgi:hypothetical protein
MAPSHDGTTAEGIALKLWRSDLDNQEVYDTLRRETERLHEEAVSLSECMHYGEATAALWVRLEATEAALRLCEAVFDHFLQLKVNEIHTAYMTGRVLEDLEATLESI